MAAQLADPAEFEQQFIEVNLSRLERLNESLSARRWDLLCALPALLHLNNPDLPGFNDEQTPSGIRNYQPATHEVAALIKLVTGFRYQPVTARSLPILSLFMMGSSGSIAFSSKSDFDLWVCIDTEMPEPDQLLLQKKCELIEVWAEKYGVELHFFLVTQRQFRADAELTLSAESSGSAQRFLLLEEFYRTAILLAGLPPLWWIVPAEQESSYDEFVATLTRWPNIKPENYIDFGPLNDIPVEEFTGAGLWQVFKGIDSPYKSVMKIILMEAYIDEHPDTQLVSLDYKNKVHQGITELERLDPYLLMFEKADSYLTGNDQAPRAELLRHCFYLKIGDHLSQAPTGLSPRRKLRHKLMRNYVDSWGWSEEKLRFLDRRDRWSISEIMTETRDIHRELGASYTHLSGLAATHSQSTAISQADLHVLGRRLYAALERKPGKIEIVNRSDAMIAPEGVLSIHRANTQTGATVWLLHNQATGSQQVTPPLKRFASLVELLLWCLLNGVTATHTRWLTNPSQTGLNDRELTLLNHFLRQQLPLPEVLQTTTAQLAAPLQHSRLLVLVNIGHDPFAEYSRKGLRLASSHADPLCHGDSHTNTIAQIDLVYCSAWGEISCQRVSGQTAINEALQRYLTELSAHGDRYPVPQFFGFSEHDGNQAALRTEQLYIDARTAVSEAGDSNCRLIYPLGTGFGMIEKAPGGITAVDFPQREALLEACSQPPPGPMITRVDALTTGLGDLSLITELNELGKVQLFIHIDATTTHFHIIDECGHYLSQSTETYDLQGHLQHLHYFVQNIIRRLQLAGQSGEMLPVTFYQLLKSSAGAWQPREVALNIDPLTRVTDIHALAMPAGSGGQALSILFEGEEFSSLEWGAELYQQVAQQVLDRRQPGATYPIYITDVELSQPVSGEQVLQSIHYFKYKKSIEERLTAALRNLGQAPKTAEI